MPKRRPVEEDDDIEGILEDAPDDLDDEDDLLAYFGDRLGIDDDAITELAKEAAEDAGIIAALALLDLFSAGWEALDDAQADAEEAQAAFAGPDLTERLNDIAADMADGLEERIDDDWGDEDGSSITSIAEINAQSEYSDAKSEADEEAGWEYSKYVAEADACDVCKDCDGTVLPSDDPWWDDHSPDANHPNCRCITVPLSAEEAKREGIDRDGPEVEVSGWKDNWPPDVSNRPEVLAGIYQEKISSQ